MSRLDFYGNIGKVFDVEVIKGFMHIKYLEYFFDEASYQRDIDDKHVENIVKFIDDENKNYKIFPEIIITLPESQYLEEAGIKIKRGVIKSYGKVLTHIRFNNLETLKKGSYCQIVDGNHRVKALVKSQKFKKAIAENENYQVPVAFVNIKSKIEGKAFFYYLNAKSKRLLSQDFFRYLEDEKDENQFEQIDEEVYLFKIIFDELKILVKNKYSYKEKYEFYRGLLELSNYLVKLFYCDELKFMLQKDSYIFNQLIDFYKKSYEKFNYDSILSKINMLKLSAYLMNEKLKTDINRYTEPNYNNTNQNDITNEAKKIKSNNKNFDEDLKRIEQEFLDFKEWLDSSKLSANELDNLNAIEGLYKVYKKTYKPKRKKIFLSMPFDRETEVTYFAIKDVIAQLNKDFNLDLELKRVDKHIYPTSDYIPQRVYKEIDECGLMIADLTGNNRNVYNEIGYKTALDKELKESQIILIYNTDSYYDENIFKYEKELKEKGYKRGEAFNEVREKDKIEDTFEIKVKELKNIEIGFNISAISQIRFKDTKYLQDRLKEMLREYFTNYRIEKSI